LRLILVQTAAHEHSSQLVAPQQEQQVSDRSDLSQLCSASSLAQPATLHSINYSKENSKLAAFPRGDFGTMLSTVMLTDIENRIKAAA
jgi:hypothetical protein